ncbi:PIN-like domain-containing protein [Lacticaseibacillus saniviri]
MTEYTWFENIYQNTKLTSEMIQAESTLLVLDTNTLLDLVKLKDEKVSKILKKMNGFQGDYFISHFVFWEFADNLATSNDVAAVQSKEISDRVHDIDKNVEKITSQIIPVSFEEFFDDIRGKRDELKSKIKK